MLKDSKILVNQIEKKHQILSINKKKKKIYRIEIKAYFKIECTSAG